MVADVVYTFSFSLNDVDSMEWGELVRWHGQHQRLQEEQLSMAQVTSQMSSLALLGGGGETEEGVPQEYEETLDVDEYYGNPEEGLDG